ncbi:MAG: SOS response-associated peptidase [Xanthomonadaceae bacterium]|nr:SOS response-associated peptidase [Xanthomonadaceae bacterium]
MSSKSLTDLAKEFDAEIGEDFSWKPHVFPKYQSPVITESKGHKLLTPMQFGLVPFFEKEEKPKMVFHNARIETIEEKVSFKRAYAETRCLIPVDSFFEYVEGAGGKKKLVQFVPKSGGTMLAAGIWSVWNSPKGEKIRTYSMITSDPPEIIAETGHDRCPLFLRPDKWDQWLEGVTPQLKKSVMKELAQFEFEVLG